MKLSNFLAYDPEFSGVGLKAGSKLDSEIWTQFSDDPIKLRQLAQTIVSNGQYLETAPDYQSDQKEEDEEAIEGRILTKTHKTRERDGKIVRRKKETTLRLTGALACECCGFDFLQFYGERGREFAECHHSIPVSELRPKQKTNLSDLRIVCANCHRMIHRKRPWLSVEELSRSLEQG